MGLPGARGQRIVAVVESTVLFAFANSQRSAQRTGESCDDRIVVNNWMDYLRHRSVATPHAVINRFSTQETVYGVCSASGRAGHVSALFSAWLHSPTAHFIGLGYVAFRSIWGRLCARSVLP
jgi:hypothetical protein